MYEIIGIYRGQSEVIDTADSRKEARELMNEYRIAFGTDWSIKIKKV